MTDEAWGFEWGSADGHGGFVRLSLHRAERVAWFWAYLWRPGLGPVVVRDHEVMLPRGSALEIRADALWSELVCETPGEHWSIGLEAFGVALDDPADALTGEIGQRIALGFDLEWETEGEPFRSEQRDVAFTDQPGRVRGEVLLGRDRIPVDTPGSFEHSLGPVDAHASHGADPQNLGRSCCTRSMFAWNSGEWHVDRKAYDDGACAAWAAGGGLALTGRAARDDLGFTTIQVRAAALIPGGQRRTSRFIGIGAGERGRRGVGWLG